MTSFANKQAAKFNKDVGKGPQLLMSHNVYYVYFWFILKIQLVKCCRFEVVVENQPGNRPG